MPATDDPGTVTAAPLGRTLLDLPPELLDDIFEYA
ncbi:hypothetical protein RTBOTA2_000689 [Rhodotorula toruloides]|nr:hypothetical protein RTBOTA2_000689 [Rhodotorula toruloides]